MMAAHLREENRPLVDSDQLSDRTLVWLTGLLGAGILSVNDFSRRLPSRCGSQASRPMIPAVERPGR
jgi:hypothetical protein